MQHKVFRRYLTLAVTMLFLLVIFTGQKTVASANSAAPIRADDGRGISFKQHEHVKIESEVLDIQLNEGTTANITATYTMKNTSNQSLSVETMFITPVEYGDNTNISVQKNGEEVLFSEEFFAFYEYNYNEQIGQDIEEWEIAMQNTATMSEPFGSGSGFFEYTFSAQAGQQVSVNFLPSGYYFWDAQSYQSFSNGRVVLQTDYSYSNYSNNVITLVTDSYVDIQTNAQMQTAPIANIYDYLYARASVGADEMQQRFSLQQFYLYLASVNSSSLAQDFFHLNYIEKYVAAIVYFVEFEPNEQLQLSVSYVYQMGVSGYRHTASLSYYLSPAKYWQDFANIQINLTLSEKYKKLKSSSIDFEKVDELKYSYTADTLPNKELSIVVSDGVIITQGVIMIIFLVVVLVGMVVLFVLVVLGVMSAAKMAKTKLIKNKQTSMDEDAYKDETINSGDNHTP